MIASLPANAIQPFLVPSVILGTNQRRRIRQFAVSEVAVQMTETSHFATRTTSP